MSVNQAELARRVRELALLDNGSLLRRVLVLEQLATARGAAIEALIEVRALELQLATEPGGAL